MQVFKAFFKIGSKKLGNMSIYFIIFAALTFLLSGSASKNDEYEFSSTSLDVCIIDEDNSSASKAFYDYISTIHNIVELSNDKETIQDNLYYRNIQYVLIIPKGYETNLLNGNLDNLVNNLKEPNSFRGTFVDYQISKYLSVINMYLTGGYDLDEALTLVQDTSSLKADINIISFSSAANSKDNPMYYFFAYLPYIFVVLIIAGLTPILITLNQKELTNRISCSPLTTMSKNLQIILGSSFYAIGIWALFMALGFVVYGLDMFTTYGLISMLNSFVFILVALSITTFISYFAPSFNVLNMIGNVIGLGMSFLCGVFVPQWLLAEELLSISRFLPAYWYVRANNMAAGLVSETYSFDKYLKYIGIELLFAVAIFSAALVLSKIKQEKRIL